MVAHRKFLKETHQRPASAVTPAVVFSMLYTTIVRGVFGIGRLALLVGRSLAILGCLGSAPPRPASPRRPGVVSGRALRPAGFAAPLVPSPLGRASGAVPAPSPAGCLWPRSIRNSGWIGVVEPPCAIGSTKPSVGHCVLADPPWSSP
jgi:hypothetical protein